MTPEQSQDLRAAFGTFITGVTVVSAVGESGTLAGFTANSYTSVSLQPPLLLVCPAKAMGCFPVFASCSHFAVSILAAEQQQVANVFANSRAPRFAQVDWHRDQFGTPIIAGASASFSCSVQQRVEAGDHVVLIGKVENHQHSDKPALGYAGGNYFSTDLERRSAEFTDSEKLMLGALIEHQGKVLLQPSVTGLQPPTWRAQASVGARRVVVDSCHKAGLQVELGATYEIFEHNSNTYIYYLAQAADGEGSTNLGAYYSYEQLPKLTYTSDALRAMLLRYAAQYQEEGAFQAYLGDNQQ